LSDEEAARLFECLHNPKHRVHNSKGAKDRMVPASPRLLAELRAYWVIHRPGNYLFPGKTPDRPLSSATVQKACKLGIALAGIRKAATPHTMRHSFATSMLEAHFATRRAVRACPTASWLSSTLNLSRRLIVFGDLDVVQPASHVFADSTNPSIIHPLTVVGGHAGISGFRANTVNVSRSRCVYEHHVSPRDHWLGDDTCSSRQQAPIFTAC
jgi:hypothetical protein